MMSFIKNLSNELTVNYLSLRGDRRSTKQSITKHEKKIAAPTSICSRQARNDKKNSRADRHSNEISIK